MQPFPGRRIYAADPGLGTEGVNEFGLVTGSLHSLGSVRRLAAADSTQGTVRPPAPKRHMTTDLKNMFPSGSSAQFHLLGFLR